MSDTSSAITQRQYEVMAERVDITSTVVALILDMLTANPMVSMAVGPAFVKEAQDISNRLGVLKAEYDAL